MKKVCLSLLMGLMVQMTFGQTLEKMQWFNEPEQWEIKNNVLSMSVTPQSDYWRISHYDFTVDDLKLEDYVTGPQIKNIPVAV